MARAKTTRGRVGPPLALTGPVTLGEVVRLRGLLLAAMSDGDELRLDLSASGPWDLAGLQLVLSAAVMARNLGRRMILDGIPDAFRALAESASATEFLDGVAVENAARTASP